MHTTEETVDDQDLSPEEKRQIEETCRNIERNSLPLDLTISLDNDDEDIFDLPKEAEGKGPALKPKSADFWHHADLRKRNEQEGARGKLDDLKKRAAAGSARKSMDADAAVIRRAYGTISETPGEWWTSPDFTAAGNLAPRTWKYTCLPTRVIVVYEAMQDAGPVTPFIVKLRTPESKAVESAKNGRRLLHERIMGRLRTALRREPLLLYTITKTAAGRLIVRGIIQSSGDAERERFKAALRKAVGEFRSAQNLQTWFANDEYARIYKSRQGWVAELSLSVLNDNMALMIPDPVVQIATKFYDGWCDRAGQSDPDAR